MASIDLEYNSGFQIYNSDDTPFHDLVLHKCTYETVVMSLGDKISGILYYKDNALDVTMSEYIIYKGVRYTLVNPPTILREGLVSDNSELRGMTKYSFTFYHPMYVLNNFPFSDIAVQSGQSRYLSQNKTFSWIGTLVDFVAKLNKNLEDTQWMVTIGNVTQEEQTKLSEVLSFDKNTIAEALKRGYETWEVPYVVDQLTPSSPYYPEKRFVVQYGLPTTEILDEYNQPFVFQMGQGVGLKNNSRNPKNNKIITRIAGYGSEDNIPYGYPQIPYYGGNVEYPLYYGIVGGQRVQLIKHPFTRNHLMPSVYSQSVYNKVNPKLSDGNNNPNYDPTIELVDYYDANDNTYTNRIKPNSPSYEIHEFGDIKPELGEKSIISAVPVSQQETQPDYKQKSDFLQEILDRISATEIEDEKTELLDVYDRVERGLSYYKQEGEKGGETYWYVFSITRDNYYEYVSYESGNYNFTATMLRDGSSAPTPDWDDTMDDDGNYLQSYFKITLPILEFDLYACAAITQEMKINMRSGACIGCTFPVEVDWDDYKRNFYNSDGEFDPDGEQRDYTKYPDSSSGQITVMVKKELETFGTLMPNQYQQPTTGDKFVILGISLPNTYITSAEQRLDTDMKQYMRDNNVYYFDYPLKFDEHFLISHEDILSQMKNNVVVRFNYAGTEHALYIKQMSVKYNESPLPKYDITLTDDIEIVLNQIGQVTDEVSKLRLGFGAGGFGTVGAEYIRKDIDDTARGTIRMIKGMQVGERFVTGLLGEGGVFRKDSDGTTYLETDKLYVRMKAYFDTVEVKHYLHTGGNRIASQASGIVCSRVEMIDAYGGLAMDVADAVLFRCFFKANDGDKTIRNDFMIGDLAFCRETNVDVSSVNLHGYWRLVIGRNENGFLTENKEAWIDLSNRASDTITVGGRQYSCAGYQNGSDAPIAQDDIIQLGNIVDKDRQGAIVEYVGGEDAPSYQIFQGIGEDLPYPYTLEDKNYIGLGYSSQTGHAYMNVYGDVFIGAKPDAVTGESPTYIKYDSDNEELTIKAVMEIIPTSTIGGETLEEYIQEHQTIYDDTDVLNAISDLENITDNLQDQIDGAIETLYGDVDPSVPANDPYRNYTTEEKENHLGDMYYNSTTGYAYRYDKKVEDNVTTYFWQLIRDSGITEAIARAGEAVNLANSKGKIFTTADNVLPTPPYNINDLWVSAKGTWGNITYDNDILKCVTARALNATASINDWVKASKYTDDSSLQNFISFTYDPENAQLHKQIDGKIDTFFTEETEDPSSNWTTTALKEDHVDDVWYQTDTDRMFRYIKVENGGVTSYRWDEIYDELAKQAYRHAAIAQDTADGKRRVFVSQPQDSDAYDVGDLWVNASYTSGNEIIYDNDVLRCKEAKEAGDTFDISHWQKASKYTDDTDFNTFVQNTYSSDQANLQNQIDGKYETWFLNGVPTLNNAPANEWTTIALKDEHLGDLYWDKTNLHAYRFVKDNLTYSWLQIGDNGVICAMADAANAQDTADKKRRVFLSEPTPPYDQGDLWTQGGSGDIMMCVTSRSSGSYNAADWAKASKYTNDALLLTFLDGYQGNLTAITNQVDAKLDTWVSSSDPSVRWTSNDLKELHVGDIWLNTNDSTVSGVGSMKSAVYTKNGSAYSWVEDNTIPNSVFDTIDGKRSIYVTWQAWRNGNVNNLKERDLFIPESDTTQGNVTYKANKVYRCTSASQETFQEVAYTDDTKVNAIIAKYGQIMNIQGATANDIGEALGHLREVLGGSTTVDGGLVLTNAIYMKDTAATPSIWAGISGVYKTAETGTGYKGHGTASWYGGGVSNGIPIDHEVSPSASNYAKSLFRFDGSGYLAGGNITWTKDGQVTISDLYTMISGESDFQTDVLNKATLFSNLFHTSTTGTEVGTLTRILPQAAFKYIDIDHDSNYTFTDSSVLNYGEMKARFVTLEFFNALFSAFSVANPTSSTTPIDPSTWTAQTVINNLKIKVGTWTQQYLSALGYNSSSSGSGGGDVYWSQLINGTGGDEQISASLLHNVTKTLSIYYDENPAAITYNGRSTQGTPVLITRSYAEGRYVKSVKVNGSTYTPTNGLVDLGTISGGGSNDRLVSVDSPLSVSSIYAMIGQPTIGTAAGNAYAGSSNNANLWSYPAGGTSANGTIANIQNIRIYWDATYFTDFFSSPNNNHLFHRNVQGGTAGDWYVIPQYKYVQNAMGLGSATKPVYIDSNGKLVEANSYPSTLDSIADGTTRKLADYLPLSGGKLTGSNFNVIDLDSTEGSEVGIRMFSNNNYKAAFGWRSEYGAYMWNYARGKYLLYKDSGTLEFEGNTVVHSGNISSYLSTYATQTWVGQNYLPLIGGTLNGSNFNTLDVNSTYEGETGIRIFNKSSYKACFGWRSGVGAYMYNASRKNYLGYTDSGTLEFEGKTVLHTGNYSSYLGYIGTTAVQASSAEQNLTGIKDITCNKSTITIFPEGKNNFNEGLRIHSSNLDFAGVIFCGSDNTGDTGTSAKTWSLYTYGGRLYINKNSSTVHTGNELCNIDGNWGIATVSPSYKLHVDGTFYASGNSSIGGTFGVTGATTLSSTLGVSGATTLSSTLGVTGNTTLSGTLSVSNATTLSSTLGVTGAATLSSTLSVSGDTTLGGKLTVNNYIEANVTAESSTAPITSKNQTSGGGWVFDGLLPNQSKNYYSHIVFGKQHDSYKAGTLSYYFADNNSTNFVGIGFYGNDGILRVYGNKELTFSNTFKVNSLGCVSINPSGQSWNEGIRIHSSSLDFAGLVFCGSDNTGDTGTSAKTWSIYTKGGNLYINKNGSIGHTGNELCNVSGNWGIGTVSPSTSLHVVGRVTCEYDSTKSGSFYATRGDYTTYYGINSSGFAMITTAHKGASSSTVRISMTPYTAQEQYIMFGMSSNFIMGTGISGSTSTYRDGAYIQIGGARIVWDDGNKALKVIQSDNSTAANFYATGAVSALGANSSSGGGSGGDVYWSQLINGTGGDEQISASLLHNVTKTLSIYYDENPVAISYNGRSTQGTPVLITRSYAEGRYVKQSGNATISGTATIGGNMTIGATVAVGSVSSQVIQTLNSRAIYIKTGSAPNYVDGTWSNTSDIRLKDIINNVGASVDQIANAPIFNYKWKSGGVSIMLGSSAQYWQNVFQHAVEIGPENYLYMDYSSVALASAVMVARKVQNHEDRIAYLERENENLRNRIKQLEAA